MARGYAAGHGVDLATAFARAWPRPSPSVHGHGCERRAKGEQLARSGDMHIGRAFRGAGSGRDVSSV